MSDPPTIPERARPTLTLWEHVFADQPGVLCVFSGTREPQGGGQLARVHEAFFDYPNSATEALEWLAKEAARAREVYTCAHLLRRDANGRVARRQEYAAPISALWCDSDKGIIPDLCPPTLTLESSPGHHDSFWRLPYPIEPARAEALNKRIAAQCEVKNDGADLTQLLRPVGFPNRKYTAKPLTRILHGPDARTYDPDELERILPIVPLVDTGRSSRSTDDAWDDSPADLDEIVAECAWLRHCRDDADSLAEPEWHAMLSITGRCEDGVRRAHEWSAPYPRYDPVETAQKLAHALSGAGPRTCAAISADLGGETYCFACPHFQQITSPIVLGRGVNFSFTFDADPEQTSHNSQNSQGSVPKFPTECLPEVARDFVREGAASLGCADDFVAVPLLGETAGVIGRSQQLRLKQNYLQRAILWFATVAPPGTGKSPGQELAQMPLEVLQQEAFQRYSKAVQAYRQDIEDWEAQTKRERGPKPPEPPDLEHFYTTDSTIEAVAIMLGGPNACTPGFAVVHDELSGWVLSFNAYRSGSDKQKWSSMWAGAPLKSDRATRDSIYVPEPVIAVYGGIQPDLLGTLAADAGRRDGFVERILYSYPETGPIYWSDEEVRTTTRNRLLRTLRLSRKAPKGIVNLAADARQRYIAWTNTNADLQKSITGITRGYYAKLPNQVARLALVLHCLEHPKAPRHVPLSLITMENAITLGEYFREHAHKALAHFGAVTSLSQRLSPAVLRVLDAAEGNWITRTQIHNCLHRHYKADELTAALTELERIGSAQSRTLPPPEHGGTRVQEWRRLK
jgi:hypothetical protein